MDKEILSLGKRLLLLDKKEKKFGEMEDRFYKTRNEVEKKMIKILKKRMPKQYKSVSVKGEGIKITLPIRIGWLKVSKIK